MSRRGENIYKRKDGRWEGRFLFAYDEEGRAKYKYIYDKSYSVLREKLKNLSSSCNTNIQNSKKETQAQKFSYWLDKWIVSKKSKIKLSTYTLYNNYIQNHIIPHLGNYPINKMSKELLENYVQNLLQTGRLDKKGGLSQKTVADILVIIKEVFKFAKSEGSHTLCNLDKITVSKKHCEMRVLNHSEQEKLIKLLLDDIDLYKLGFLLSLYTGIRIGELCALKWSNIFLDDGSIKVEHTMQRIQNDDKSSPQKTRIIITSPKSFSSIRVIPLPVFIIELLKQFKNRPKSFFLSGKSQTYVEPRTMQNKLKKYYELCKIHNASCHSLRHTFCTNCIEAGFDIKTLSEIMGHSSVRITLDKYAHSSMKLKRENMSKLKLI